MATTSTAAERGTHVHLAAFFKMSGQNAFHQWPEEIAGGNLIGALDGKADFPVLMQTVGIKDGDVLNIRNNV